MTASQFKKAIQDSGREWKIVNGKIGFTNGQSVWHWFHTLTGSTVYYDHSYSMNTGKTHKGHTQREKVMKSLSVMHIDTSKIY